jgi:hypothetical protein
MSWRMTRHTNKHIIATFTNHPRLDDAEAQRSTQ